nr:hypothetical protein [Tanacetum cinerariifolium]
MEMYMLNRQHGRMILESVENGPLLWPTVKENGVTRLKKYSELSTTESIEADCDVKATNIILQVLPPEVYELFITHKVAKELWERIQMLMQGTSLTKQEKECKLYDEFDKFVNTKFLNTLPPEWSKFVTDVKLLRDLYTTNVDQLHAYLGQHEYHANEVRLMHERTSDPLALVAYHQMNKSTYQPHQQSYHQHQFQPQVSPFQYFQYGTRYHSSQYALHAPSSTHLSLTYLSNDFQSSVNYNVYNPSSLMPHMEYALAVHQQTKFTPPDTGLIVLVFQKESVENGPLLWPTVKENGVTRLKKYSELSTTESIEADCDVKATNIILQVLPPEVNTKFLNTLPPEWSKFVTDVKLLRDLYTTNVDQLHAYLGQHEYHANEVRLMHERTSDPLALVAYHQMNKSTYQPHQQSYHQHQFQPQVSPFQYFQYGTRYHSSQYALHAPSSTHLSLTYLSNDFQSSVNYNVYNPSSLMPHMEYALAVHQQTKFTPPDTGLIVLVFQKGDDPIDAIIK